jgi:hypothetical protein
MQFEKESARVDARAEESEAVKSNTIAAPPEQNVQSDLAAAIERAGESVADAIADGFARIAEAMYGTRLTQDTFAAVADALDNIHIAIKRVARVMEGEQL